MKRWTAIVAIVLVAACTNRKSEAKPFDRERFLVESIQVTQSNAELGAVAARRAWAPVTRQLGETMRADQQKLHGELLALAAKRGVKPPAPVMDRHVALRENLATLPGQVFDRGYALAMVQELEKLERDAAAAGASDDAELARLGTSLRPRLETLRNQAQEVLDRNGGSPFHF